jgi:hypothetical protein
LAQIAIIAKYSDRNKAILVLIEFTFEVALQLGKLLLLLVKSVMQPSSVAILQFTHRYCQLGLISNQ